MTQHPTRTYSQTHPQVGYLDFTIPVQSPQDVDAYLVKKFADVPLTHRMKLHSELLKIATELWSGYALWVGDPEIARLELRRGEEISQWIDS